MVVDYHFITQILSRAFRNRFVELHFAELPSTELELILHQRCNLPKSYAKKLVSVMLELQVCLGLRNGNFYGFDR